MIITFTTKAYKYIKNGLFEVWITTCDQGMYKVGRNCHVYKSKLSASDGISAIETGD